VHHRVSIALPPVEVGLELAAAVEGAQTKGLKVIEESRGERSLTLRLVAPAGSTQRLVVVKNDAAVRSVKASGADVAGDQVTIVFPTGSGYQASTVALTW
jgi:hypothetical protein